MLITFAPVGRGPYALCEPACGAIAGVIRLPDWQNQHVGSQPDNAGALGRLCGYESGDECAMPVAVGVRGATAVDHIDAGQYPPDNCGTLASTPVSMTATVTPSPLVMSHTRCAANRCCAQGTSAQISFVGVVHRTAARAAGQAVD